MTNPWVLTVYHADWCGHCKDLLEGGGEWEKLKNMKIKDLI